MPGALPGRQPPSWAGCGDRLSCLGSQEREVLPPPSDPSTLPGEQCGPGYSSPTGPQFPHLQNGGSCPGRALEDPDQVSLSAPGPCKGPRTGHCSHPVPPKLRAPSGPQHPGCPELRQWHKCGRTDWLLVFPDCSGRLPGTGALSESARARL